MKNLKYSIKQQEGFTLLEMVIALVILGIITLATMGIISVNARTFNSVKNTTAANWDLRKTLHAIRQDVQQISPPNLIYENNGQFSSAKLNFTDRNGTAVSYERSSNIFRRKVGAQAWVELLTTMNKDPFSFLDINSNPTNNRNNVAFIEVSLQIPGDTQDITMDDKFYVRN